VAPIRPATALTDGTLVLTPVSEADAAELQEICDLEGWNDMQVPGITNVFMTVPGCKRLFVWADALRHSWDAPGFREVHTCFAVRARTDANALAGVIGFTRSNRPQWHGRLTTYYWTAPAMRGKGVATGAVRLATPWALEAWEAGEVFIHALNETSEKVATKAGFKRTEEVVWGFPVFRRGAG
jgi:RimJ/RimL family protein N-acetyltransferase